MLLDDPVQTPSPVSEGWLYVPSEAVASANVLFPCFSQLKVIPVIVLSEEMVIVLLA